MAQEESWECPVTTNGKYANALLKDIKYWKSLEDLKLNIMLINEALDIPYEKDEELEKLKIKKLQEFYYDIEYELLPDHYKRNKDIIMSWAKGPNLYLEDLDCNLIDKDVVLRFIDYKNSMSTEDVPNQFKKDKDVILALLGNSFGSMGFYDDACIWMDESLKKDKEFVMELIKKKFIHCDTFIKECSSYFKADKDIILAFVQNINRWDFEKAYKKNKSLFDWIDDTIKDDKEFMKKIVGYEIEMRKIVDNEIKMRKKMKEKHPHIFTHTFKYSKF